MVLPSGEYRRSTALSGEQCNAYLKHMEIAYEWQIQQLYLKCSYFCLGPAKADYVEGMQSVHMNLFKLM